MTTTFLALMGRCSFHHPRETPQINGETSSRPCASESFADFIITPAARDSAGDAVAIRVEHHAGVIVVAAQLRKVEAGGEFAGLGEPAQGGEGALHLRNARQAL